LQHVHILPVYDYGEHDNMPFIVMAYMAGGTLADRIMQGPMPMNEIIRIMGQVGRGLDFAHRNGIVHRDFKPTNVLLDMEGDAYLMDFGIAKVSEQTIQITRTGKAPGTPAFMAPEMYDGTEPTAAVDIYALGVTLYMMLTLRLPFQATTPRAFMRAHLDKPVPDVCVLRPDLPAPVQTVIERAMAKSPDDRFSSASMLVQALSTAPGSDFVTQEARPAMSSDQATVLDEVPAHASALPSDQATELDEVPSHASVPPSDQATVLDEAPSHASVPPSDQATVPDEDPSHASAPPSEQATVIEEEPPGPQESASPPATVPEEPPKTPAELERSNSWLGNVLKDLFTPAQDPRETLAYTRRRQREQFKKLRLTLGDVVASSDRLETEMAQVTEKLTLLEEQAQRALEVENEELARLALKRRHIASLQLQELEEQMQQARRDEQGFARQIEDAIAAQASAADADVPSEEALSAVTQELADLRLTFEQAQHRAERMQTRVSAIGSFVEEGIQELSDLPEDHPIERERTLLDQHVSRLDIIQDVEDRLDAIKDQIRQD
jgi:serine/threonine protein kinase